MPAEPAEPGCNKSRSCGCLNTAACPLPGRPALAHLQQHADKLFFTEQAQERVERGLAFLRLAGHGGLGLPQDAQQLHFPLPLQRLQGLPLWESSVTT